MFFFLCLVDSCEDVDGVGFECDDCVFVVFVFVDVEFCVLFFVGVV